MSTAPEVSDIMCIKAHMIVYGEKMLDLFGKEMEFYVGRVGQENAQEMDYCVAEKMKEEALLLYNVLAKCDHENVVKIRAMEVTNDGVMACIAYKNIIGTLGSYFSENSGMLCTTNKYNRDEFDTLGKKFLCDIAKGINHMNTSEDIVHYPIELNIEKIFIGNESSSRNTKMAMIGEVDVKGSKEVRSGNWNRLGELLEFMVAVYMNTVEEEVNNLKEELILNRISTIENFLWHPAMAHRTKDQIYW